MNEMQKKVSAIGVVPVIKLTNPTRDAGPLSDALCAGGVPVAEITFRAAGADEAMRIMLERHPDMLVGAGTVLTTEMVDKTIAAGGTYTAALRENGTVVLSLWTPETGYMVELQHAGNLLSVYKGLSQSLVTKGQTIRAGELIGYNAEAEQGEVRLFEFELWNNGKPVDPEGYIVFQ